MIETYGLFFAGFFFGGLVVMILSMRKKEAK